MEGDLNFKIENTVNDDGEAFVKKLADLIHNTSGNKNSIKKILKANHVSTDTVFLDEYIDLLVKNANDKNKLCDAIKDIGTLIGQEHSVFEDFETMERDRANPVWKDHQDRALMRLNEIREKQNLRKLKLDEDGEKIMIYSSQFP